MLQRAGGGLSSALPTVAGLDRRTGVRGAPVFTPCRPTGGPPITGPGTDDAAIVRSRGPEQGGPKGKVGTAPVIPIGQLLCRRVEFP